MADVGIGKKFYHPVLPEEEEEVENYIRIPVENLLPGRPLPFSLYYAIDSDFILFRGAGKVLEKSERERLLHSHLTEVFIDARDTARYRAYLDQLLKEFLVAGNIPLQQKVETFYSLASGIGKEVLNAPDRPESISTAAEVVRGAVRLLGHGREVLHHLMGFMARQHDLVTHSINVTNYGLALARAAGNHEPEALLNLGLGLFLHDVGLRMIPAKILKKKSLLTFEERCLVRQHTQLGADLFSSGDLIPKSSIAVIRDHHERMDGTGYPRGLTAEHLSQEARIAQIVSAFSLLTTNLPNRRAISSYEALRTMQRDQPRGFDPDFLRHFIRIIGI